MDYCLVRSYRTIYPSHSRGAHHHEGVLHESPWSMTIPFRETGETKEVDTDLSASATKLAPISNKIKNVVSLT